MSDTHTSRFLHGAEWVRADFHLHTRADREFVYKGEENSFVKDYVEGVVSADIRVGVITNHNKFKKDEFTALRKAVKRRGIALLPGVELSTADGHNGVHMLVIYSDGWIEGGKDLINPFLSSMFTGRDPSDYENENGRSEKTIIQAIETLNQYELDYFVIFAHVEQKSGLWKELGGGKIQDFTKDRYAEVRRHTLGFQKVHTRDLRAQVQQHLGGWYPSEVEGSDAKSCEDIGKGNPCYLKLGDLNFNAVRYALTDYPYRVAKEVPEIQRSYIESVSYEGGRLDGKSLHFSPELNCLIGIRGSGKSSVIETVRYALNLRLGEDETYKSNLVRATLGSGGQITVHAQDRFGQAFEIRRVLNENPEVFVDGTLQPGVSIRETVIHHPVYFGQKDLSSGSESFEGELVSRLVGEALDQKQREIQKQKAVVIEEIERLRKVGNLDEEIGLETEKLQNAKFQLKLFKERGIDEKLKRQSQFETERRYIDSALADIDSFMEGVDEALSEYEDEIRNRSGYESKENHEFFTEFAKLYDDFIKCLDQIKSHTKNAEGIFNQLNEKREAFQEIHESAKSEFAEIRREVEKEIESSSEAPIDLDAFPKLTTTIAQAKKLIGALEKSRAGRTAIETELQRELSKLNEFWREEFRLIQAELEKVNAAQSALRIDAKFKGDTEAFLAHLQSAFRGSKIRETTFRSLVEDDDISDFITIYEQLDSLGDRLGSTPEVFREFFNRNLNDFLTHQVPNRIEIFYHEKPLRSHSLGQRASALILFVLAQDDNDLIMIDQPEDDLDNQTIYEDVIKLVRSKKPETQFIFATHNANFPVLGDAEQVHACRFGESAIEVSSGSVDRLEIQTDIVDIMEGGEDAFRRRKQIYEIWK